MRAVAGIKSILWVLAILRVVYGAMGLIIQREPTVCHRRRNMRHFAVDGWTEKRS